MRRMPEDGPVRDGVVQPPHEEVGARVREVLEPGAGDRELTLATARARIDLCGLAWTNPLEYLCFAGPAYVVTSTEYPDHLEMTFLVCVDHAHLVRSMKWFQSMRSLPHQPTGAR